MLVGAAVVLDRAAPARDRPRARPLREPRSLSVRLGLAYPLARRFRTSMTLGMFALVVFILVYVSVFASMFAGQTRRVHGRRRRAASTCIVSSNPSNPVDFDALAREPGVHAVAPLVTQRWRKSPRAGLTTTRELADVGIRPVARRHTARRSLDDAGGYAQRRRRVRGGARTTRASRSSTTSSCTQGAGPPENELDIGDTFTVRDPASGGETHVHRRRDRPERLRRTTACWIGNRRGPRRLRRRRGREPRLRRRRRSRRVRRRRSRAGSSPTAARPTRSSTSSTTAIAQQQQFFLLMRALPRARARRRHRRHRRDHGPGRTRAPPPGRRAARARDSRPRPCGPRSSSSRRSSRSKAC